MNEMRKQQFTEAHTWVRAELDRCVNFWLKNGMDPEFGGVYTCLDRTGKIYSTDKSVWMQGRCGWIFAHLCTVYGTKPEWLHAPPPPLPVEPPEVNAFGLQIVVHGEIGVHIVRVGQVEFEVLTACRIDAHAPGGLRVGAFECADAVAWMHVERGLEALAVQLVEECHMVGEQVAVPRIAGPSGTVLRVDAVHEMPVHVDHGRGERNALTLEAVHKRQVFGLRVPVVAAPPIAECETRQQRLRAGEPVEVLHGFDVAVRIAEEVQVDAPLVAR